MCRTCRTLIITLTVCALVGTVLAGTAVMANSSSNADAIEFTLGARCSQDNDCGGRRYCDRGRCRPIRGALLQFEG